MENIQYKIRAWNETGGLLSYCMGRPCNPVEGWKANPVGHELDLDDYLHGRGHGTHRLPLPLPLIHTHTQKDGITPLYHTEPLWFLEDALNEHLRLLASCDLIHLFCFYPPTP